MIEHTDNHRHRALQVARQKTTKMTSESAYSIGSSYLNVAVPTQDIAEDNLLIVNVDTGLHCVTPRERLPVLDSVNMNESQLQVHPQRTVNTMALMDNTEHGSVHALTRSTHLLRSTVMSGCAPPPQPSGS